MFDDELEVFYDEDDFAVECTRSRPGVVDVVFTGILATVDAEQFDGHAMLSKHRLQFPAAVADLAAQDTLRTVRTTSNGVRLPAEVWRVMRSPELVVDGAEAVAYLKPDPEA